MWKQYEENKDVYQQLAILKPDARDSFSEKRRVELILFDSAASYFDELKASGEAITPQKWQAEKERLVDHKNSLFQQVKDMRQDIALLEKFRKSAEGISDGRKSKVKEHEYER